MKYVSLVSQQTVFACVFAFVLATAGSLIAWTGPGVGVTPPDNNAAAPINVGSAEQTKTGGIWAASIGSDGGYCIGVDCITAWSDVGGGWLRSGGNTYTTSGNVGIETASPTAKLELGDNQWIMLRAQQNTAGINFFETGTVSATDVQYGGKIFYNGNGDTFQIVTRENGADKLGIVIARTSGNVGIGTTSPAAKLDVNGNANVSGLVTASGFFHSSDERLKKDVTTFAHPLDVIQQLRGVSFTWKDTNTPSVGLIAQEVAQVLPSAVRTQQNGYKVVEYDQLIGVLVEAVKGQQQQLREQEDMIRQQQAQLSALQYDIQTLTRSR